MVSKDHFLAKDMIKETKDTIRNINPPNNSIQPNKNTTLFIATYPIFVV